MGLPLTLEQEDWLKKQGAVAYSLNEWEPDLSIIRGKHYVRTAGYAAPPGSGPKGETCKTCSHSCAPTYTSGTYYKCGLNQAAWRGSRKTDILLSAPACKHWEKK